MTTDTTAPSLREKLEPYIAIIGPMVMILAILLFMLVAEPTRYFRVSNLNLILLDAALYMPMAMAMTFVITQRGIDLSIGSIAALSGIIMAFLIKQYGYSVYVAVPIAILLGAAMGLINGLIITRFNVPDLIGTLAMDLVYRGFALVLAKGLVLARFPDFLTDIGRGQIPGFVPIPVLIGIATMTTIFAITPPRKCETEACSASRCSGNSATSGVADRADSAIPIRSPSDCAAWIAGAISTASSNGCSTARICSSIAGQYAR